MSFVDHLRKLKTAADYRNSKQKDDTNKKVQLAKETALFMLEMAKRKAERAAAKGKNSIFLKKLEKYGGKHLIKDLTSNVDWNSPSILEITSPYYHLFDYLAKEGLKPTLRWAYDGDGISDWYELWISWD